MKVWGLILVLLVPWLVHAEPQYAGTRVTSLTLSGADSQDDLRLIPLKVGDIITPEKVRDSIQALYDTQKYTYIEVDASKAPDGGTDLVFRVQMHFYFASVRMDPPDLLERALSNYISIPLGERFRAPAVDRMVEETTNLLKSEGYFEATVTPEYDFNNTTRLVNVVLRAKSGPKAIVGSIHIQGGEQTFQEKEIRDSFNLKSGDEFALNKLDTGTMKVRAKFTNLGFLNTRVTVDRNYDPTTHLVDLNVTIQPGQFTLVETKGSDVPKKKLRELVPVFEEGAVDPDLVEEGRVGLNRYLQQEGYFEATVSSEIVEAPLDNAIQINYSITPGVRHRITSVVIQGNTHFRTDFIRSRIKVHSAQLFNRGAFSTDLLDDDVRTIQALYRNEGFDGTNVRGSYEEMDHTIAVLIQIDEGKQLLTDAISFAGNQAVSDQELRRIIGLKEGDIYTPAAVDRARAAITQLYHSKGYPDLRIDATADRFVANNGMQVTFRITEGESYRIGEILLSGNERTKDKIVYRNSHLYANTPYNPESILEGQRQLYTTGLFDRVDIVTLQQNIPGIRNLLIHVQDAKSIQLIYGLGYHEYERARGTVEISHNNLFGLDRSISLRLRGSAREQLAQTTYHEPWLFNHPLDGFASFFVEHTVQPSYTASRIDFSLQLLKRFSGQKNLLITTGYQTVNLEDIRVNIRAEELPLERGIIQIARVGASFIQDHRNDPLNPSSGFFNTTTYQVASRAIGSEINFTSLYNQYALYTPVPHGVLATSVRLGWNRPFGGTQKQGLPPTERYFAGGSTTLRGFGFDQARPAGGNVLTIGNFEYRFPLNIFPIRNLGGALFYDTGNVFPSLSEIRLSDFTHTVGWGLRYQTPLGPVRVDFGLNLKPTRADGTRVDRFKIFFTLGNPF